jgi:hypothetical protein
VKKLATKLTDETRDALIKELKTLNLNRYITELAQAVATVPLKVRIRAGTLLFSAP